MYFDSITEENGPYTMNSINRKLTHSFTLSLMSLLCIVSCTPAENITQPTSAQTANAQANDQEHSQKNKENNTDGESDVLQLDMPEHIKQLQWVKTAKPQQEAEQAIAKGDYSFWVLATRAPVTPGLNAQEHHELIVRCGEKYLPGVGDIRYGGEHSELHKQAIDFATQYNQILLTHCLQYKQ